MQLLINIRGVGRCFVMGGGGGGGGTSNTWLPWQRCLPYECGNSSCQVHKEEMRLKTKCVYMQSQNYGGGGGGVSTIAILHMQTVY